MAINFPAAPTTNQTYTFNGRTWTWNGVGWQATGSTGLTVYTKTDFTKDWEAGAEVLNPDGTPAPHSEAAVTALTAA